MIFDALEHRLEQSGLLVPGETLFRHFMPGEISVGAFMRAPLDGIKINPSMPNWYTGEIQVITRHTDPVVGEDLASRIGDVLTIRALTQFPMLTGYQDAHVTKAQPLTLPIRFPRLQGNGLEFLQTFFVAFGYIRTL